MLRGLLQKLLWNDYILLPSSSALFCEIGYPFLFGTLSWATLKLQLNKSPVFLNLYWMSKLWMRVFWHCSVCSGLFLASFLLCEGQAHKWDDWEINASNFYIITWGASLQQWEASEADFLAFLVRNGKVTSPVTCMQLSLAAPLYTASIVPWAMAKKMWMSSHF